MSSQVTATAEAVANQASGLMEKTIILSLKLGTLGTRQRVRDEQIREKGADLDLGMTPVEVDADKESLHVSKDILKSATLTAIRKHDAAVRKYIKANSVPSFFRGGMDLVRVDHVAEIDKELDRMRAVRRGLVDKFLEEYPALVEAAKAPLKGLYDEADYPTLAKVKAAFTWEQRYLTFQTPGSLKGISAEIFKREQANMAAKWEQVTDEVTALLRSQAHDLVAHMLDRLTPDEEGKPKVFRDTMVSNLSEFLATFNVRNVVDDDELSALMGQARQLLEGVDAKQLRKQEGLRESVRTKVEQIKLQLDTMVVARPKRNLKLED